MVINYDFPSGMIAPFDAACPSDWTRYTALDSKFPRGATTAGGTGGSDLSHLHSVNPANIRIHYYNTSVTVQASASSAIKYSSVINHMHYVNLPSTNTSKTTSLPTYINVIFCKKD
jgi:hypothetical protein